MMSEVRNQIISDVGKKCADDVSAAIRRNMQLADGAREQMVVGMYAAAAAIGAATGALGAFMGRPSTLTAEQVDEAWSGILRPMVLGEFAGDPQ
jgi:S-methylmethionine-dependent homocysteine/selenocysteine methylase